MKPLDNSFKAYLTYVKEYKLDSDLIQNQSRDREDSPYYEESNTSLESDNSTDNSSNEDNDSKVNYTTIFIVSNTKYNI